MYISSCFRVCAEAPQGEKNAIRFQVKCCHKMKCCAVDEEHAAEIAQGVLPASVTVCPRLARTGGRRELPELCLSPTVLGEAGCCFSSPYAQGKELQGELLESLTCDLWNLQSVRLLLSRDHRGSSLSDAVSLAAWGVSCMGQRCLFSWLEVRSQPVCVCVCVTHAHACMYVCSKDFLSKGLLEKTKRLCCRESMSGG